VRTPAALSIVLATALLAAACGGKQTKNASAPGPTVTGSTTTAGTTLPALQQETAKYVTSCTAGGGAKRKSFCRCVVQRLRATVTRRELLLFIQSGRTPPPSLQTKFRRANRACRSKLR
jgi:hypothetical protein